MPTKKKPPTKKVTECIYPSQTGDCGRPALGEPPLCAKHAKYRSQILMYLDQEDDEEDEDVIKNVVGVLSEQPIVQQIVGKVGGLLDKVASFVDKAALGELPFLQQAQQQAQQQYARYTRPAPPPPPPKEDPRVILGFRPDEQLTRKMIKERQRELAMKFHPDHNKGYDARMMARVNEAASELLKQVK